MSSSSSSGSSSLGSFAFPLAMVLGERGGRDGQRDPGVVRCHEILAGGALEGCWRNLECCCFGRVNSAA